MHRRRWTLPFEDDQRGATGSRSARILPSPNEGHVVIRTVLMRAEPSSLRSTTRDDEITADFHGRFRWNADDADVVLDTDLRAKRL
jgi:hypothetical protein